MQRINRQSLVGFHRMYYTPENLVVVVVGNIDRATAEEKVERYFGDLPASGRPPVAPTTAVLRPLSDAQCTVVKERDLSGAADPSDGALAHLLVGFPVGPITREEYPVLLVLNSLMGGGMGSRLLQEVRERQGLAYHVGSYYAEYAGAGYLGAFVKTWPERAPLDNPYQREMMLERAKPRS